MRRATVRDYAHLRWHILKTRKFPEIRDCLSPWSRHHLLGRTRVFLHRVGALLGLPIAEYQRDGAAVGVEADAQGFVVG